MSNLPQLVYLLLSFLGLGLVMSKHGEQQGPYNFWISLFAFAVAIGILYWGGFFDGLLR